MNILAVAHDRIEERAALPAADVVRHQLAKDQELILALRNVQLRSLDAGKRLERGSGRSATLRAVAVECVFELILNGVLDRSTEAAA
jgi:hypothetical protein